MLGLLRKASFRVFVPNTLTDFEGTLDYLHVSLLSKTVYSYQFKAQMFDIFTHIIHGCMSYLLKYLKVMIRDVVFWYFISQAVHFWLRFGCISWWWLNVCCRSFILYCYAFYFFFAHKSRWCFIFVYGWVIWREITVTFKCLRFIIFDSCITQCRFWILALLAIFNILIHVYVVQLCN